MKLAVFQSKVTALEKSEVNDTAELVIKIESFGF